MFHDKTRMHTNNSSTKAENILTPFQRKLLQKSFQENLSEQYRQRIQIMLLADEGKTQVQICHALGCCPATVRHWTHIARAGIAHQWMDCPIGRPKTVNEEYLERLKELVNDNPTNYGYSFRRWTTNWLRKHLGKEFGIEISDRHLKRLLKQMGLSTLPKASKAEEVKNQGKQSISIYDLKSANNSDSNGFWLFNPNNIK